MTIDAVYQLVQFVLNKTQQGNISPDQFNAIAPSMQLSVINQILGNEQEYGPGRPIPRYGFGLNQKIMEDLRPIIKIPQSISFSSGIGSYPADGIYIFNLVSVDGKLVRPVEQDEAILLNESVIKPPTTQYPCYYMLGGNMYILPSTITSGTITYVRRPLTPKWNYTISNDVPIYNPTGSQDFELGELLHLRICAKILQMAGVNLSLGQVTEYAAAIEASGA